MKRNVLLVVMAIVGCLLACDIALRLERPALAATTRVQYKVGLIDVTQTGPMEADLNEMGKQGWRLVLDTGRTTSGDRKAIMVFSR